MIGIGVGNTTAAIGWRLDFFASVFALLGGFAGLDSVTDRLFAVLPISALFLSISFRISLSFDIAGVRLIVDMAEIMFSPKRNSSNIGRLRDAAVGLICGLFVGLAGAGERRDTVLDFNSWVAGGAEGTDLRLLGEVGAVAS